MNVSFKFSEYSKRIEEMYHFIVDSLLEFDIDEARKLAEKIKAINAECKDGGSLLTVAFVGQYNAGKSTIIKALTGNENISISSDVCTDAVTSYKWSDILLLDTPGIHAGRKDHDELTYNAINRADLLVFVITNELFDNIIGRHFRELAFERKKAGEMLLVVNKMAQDPGDPEVKKPDIEKVITPLTIESLRTVFIDARTYLEALEEVDPGDREELMKISNFGAFVEALNNFVRDKRLIGRLTTPLHAICRELEEARAYYRADSPEEKAVVELLVRCRKKIIETQDRFRKKCEYIIESVCENVKQEGIDLSECLEEISSEEELEKLSESSAYRIEKLCTTIAKKIETVLEEESKKLEIELSAIANSDLALHVAEMLNKEALNYDVDIKFDRFPANPIPDKFRYIPGILGYIGVSLSKAVTKLAMGPAAKEGATLTLKSVSRSVLHKTVYKVGKFFGKSFKPWEAVKAARLIAKISKFIGPLSALIDIILTFHSDSKEQERRQEIIKAKNVIRDHYNNLASDIKNELWNILNEIVKNYFGELDGKVLEAMEWMRGKQHTAGEFISRIDDLCSRVKALIEEIQNIEEIPVTPGMDSSL